MKEVYKEQLINDLKSLINIESVLDESDEKFPSKYFARSTFLIKMNRYILYSQQLML